MMADMTVKLVLNAAPLLDFLASSASQGDVLKIGLNDALALLKTNDEFCTVKVDASGAGGTKEVIVLLEPSDALCRLLATSGAGNA